MHTPELGFALFLNLLAPIIGGLSIALIRRAAQAPPPALDPIHRPCTQAPSHSVSCRAPLSPPALATHASQRLFHDADSPVRESVTSLEMAAIKMTVPSPCPPSSSQGGEGRRATRDPP